MLEPISPHNLAFLEELYERYAHDPSSVPADYRDYFAQLGSGNEHGPSKSTGRGNGEPFRVAPRFRRRSIFDR